METVAVVLMVLGLIGVGSAYRSELIDAFLAHTGLGLDAEPP